MLDGMPSFVLKKRVDASDFLNEMTLNCKRRSFGV